MKFIKFITIFVIFSYYFFFSISSQFGRIHMNFIRFFSNLRIFFLVLKKRLNVTKYACIFAKRLHTTLKKFLDNRSRRFANTTQIFFDKRGFQKLEKNWKSLFVSGKIDESILAKKKLRYPFFTKHFFFY